MHQQRVIIFAHPRSGSTNLVLSLNLHPELHYAFEPFSQSSSKFSLDEPSYASSIHDSETLDGALNQIFQRHNGFKAIHHQLPREIYGPLLLRDEFKIIYLRRKNSLRAVVSHMIAEQSDLWHVMDPTPHLVRFANPMLPLSFEEIRIQLDQILELENYYSALMARKPESQCLFLDYEGLYTRDVRSNYEQIAKVCQFIGVDPVPQSWKLFLHLNPAASQIVTERTYLRLPNYAEIDAEFGSDQTGWLLARS